MAEHRVMPTTVLLIEDHQLVRAGLRKIIEQAPALEVIGEAASCDDAMRLARQQEPNVVLMDMTRMCLTVLDGARRFERQFPAVKVVVMNVDAGLLIPERLLQAGVAGCLSRRATEDDLIEAIQSVRAGGRFLSADLAQRLATSRLGGNGSSPFDNLTHRELQVLLMVTQGKNPSQISRDLCLTQKTVNGYRNRVMGKLGVRTDVQLMHLALQHGVIELGPRQ